MRDVRYSVKLAALDRLWKHAVRGLEIRHHDPRTSINIAVKISTWANCIDVRMDTRYTRNTDDRDAFLSSFGMTLRTAEWPGFRSARIALAGAWGMYMQHEVHELILLDGRPIADLDPHRNPSNYRQRRLEAVLQDGSLAIANAMDFALGADTARTIRGADAEQAGRELEIECRVVEGIEPIWQ